MKIDPQNLNLTPDVARELEKNYLTNVWFKDYFIDYLKYNRPLSNQFFALLKDTLDDESTDDDERWERDYKGKDAEGWEHVEYRAYKGPNPAYGDANKIHLKIHIKFKKRPVRIGSRAGGGLLGGIGNIFCAVAAMFAVDSAFPAKPGESTFGRDFLVGWGVLEALDAMDRNAELEDRVDRLERGE
jgi:hypothetical protein